MEFPFSIICFYHILYQIVKRWVYRNYFDDFVPVPSFVFQNLFRAKLKVEHTRCVVHEDEVHFIFIYNFTVE